MRKGCAIFLQENKCVGKQTSPREEACESIMYEELLWTNSTDREAKAPQISYDMPVATPVIC
jgi:hypothetical protein